MRFASIFALLPSVLLAQIAPQNHSTRPELDADASVLPPLSESSSSYSGGDESPLVLDPFSVNADYDRGYQAFSTMSGTRLNTRLEDLAASISVVTKQQLLDTAALDINDVFRYEVSTEGIYQFTSYTVDRGNVTDDAAANPQGATRMRGLSAANIAVNSFSTSLPIDTYNVESVEISRGPNSTLFGMGNAGGGVNINTAKANLTREVTRLATRVDSYDGYRASFDVNRPLIKDRAAIRLLGLYDRRGFERKPSADITRRLNALVTLRPFANTTLRGGFESHRNFNQRPNSQTPRDTYSDWVEAGRPTWDPITSTVNFLDGLPSIGPLAPNQDAANLPFALATPDTGFNGRPSWYIDNGQVELYTISRMPNASSNGPHNIGGTGRLLQNTTRYTRFSAQFPLFTTPGITDKSLYDWTATNIATPNQEHVSAEVSWGEVEQYLLRSPRQTLAFQAAWLRERSRTSSRAFLGRSNTSRLQVYIDVNERLLDGSPNPYFLRPYVGGSEPAYSQDYRDDSNYRATLGYQLDLTREQGWLRHLGRHSFTGYAEYRENTRFRPGFRDTISSTEAWMNPNAANFSRNGASFRAYPRFYIGDAVGQNVDYAPTPIGSPPITHTLRYYDGVAAQWIDEPVDFDSYFYASRPNRRLVSTTGAAWQGYLWGERVIPLLGIRRDYNRARDANSALNPSSATNGYYDTSSLNEWGQYDWVQGRGQTTTAGVVVRPLRWLGLTYSQSDAFSPGSIAYNVYGQPLPDPRGKTKDYGFDLQLFPDASGRARLSIRLKQYETLNKGRGTSEINTIVQRAIRLDADGNTTGGDPDLEGFYIIELAKLNPTWTDLELEQGAAQLMGVSAEFIDSHRSRPHGDNSDAVSRGREVELTYNPTRHWTMKATVRQSKAFNGTMSPALQEYVASRLPEWQAAVSPFDGSSFWNGGYAIGVTTPEAWYTANLLAPMKLAIATEGKMRSQFREWGASALTNFKLAGVTDHQWLKALDIGGAVRWEDKAIIGYLGAAPDLDGVIRELDANRPIYDKARYYADIMIGYGLRDLFGGKVNARFQLNIINAFESGRLQPFAVNPDGTPWGFRIIDPRRFVLSASFDM